MHGFSWVLDDLWDGLGPTSYMRPVLQAQGQLRNREVTGAGVQRASKEKAIQEKKLADSKRRLTAAGTSRVFSSHQGRQIEFQKTLCLDF